MSDIFCVEQVNGVEQTKLTYPYMISLIKSFSF